MHLPKKKRKKIEENSNNNNNKKKELRQDKTIALTVGLKSIILELNWYPPRPFLNIYIKKLQALFIYIYKKERKKITGLN